MLNELEKISKLSYKDQDEEINQLRISQMTAQELEQVKAYQASNKQEAFNHKLSAQMKKWYIANDPSINKQQAEEQITVYRQMAFIQSKKEKVRQIIKQIAVRNAQITRCKLCPFFMATYLNRLLMAYLIVFCFIVPVFLYKNLYEQQHNLLLNILLILEAVILAFALLNYFGRALNLHRHSFAEILDLFGEIGKHEKQLNQSMSVLEKYSARMKEKANK